MYQLPVWTMPFTSAGIKALGEQLWYTHTYGMKLNRIITEEGLNEEVHDYI